ncbi:MAG: hypothetical protein HY763_02360 [Planctomycetes bacterium]|nr:hypothetical protein [Planctomycetota bacterium]
MNGRRGDVPAAARSFALVLSLLLLAILAATGAALAALGGSEAIRAGRASRDLDHRLAAESVLEVLPELLQRAKSNPAAPEASSATITIRVRVGACDVVGDVQSEAGKMRVTALAADEMTARLRTLAVRHGLPPEDILPRPITRGAGTEGWPSVVWFDQLVRPRRFEELFRMLPGDDRRAGLATPTTVWSDLVTFWGDGRRPVYSVHLATAIGADLRRWYAICELTGGATKVLFLGSI